MLGSALARDHPHRIPSALCDGAGVFGATPSASVDLDVKYHAVLFVPGTGTCAGENHQAGIGDVERLLSEHERSTECHGRFLRYARCDSFGLCALD